jgi:hypothetical protein
MNTPKSFTTSRGEKWSQGLSLIIQATNVTESTIHLSSDYRFSETSENQEFEGRFANFFGFRLNLERWITYIVALTTPEAILVDGTATGRNFVAVWCARKLSVATCSSCTTTRFKLKIFRQFFKGLTITSCEFTYSWLSSLRSWHENRYNFLHISDHALQKFVLHTKQECTKTQKIFWITDNSGVY